MQPLDPCRFQWPCVTVKGSDGVKDMTHEAKAKAKDMTHEAKAKAKAKAKDLTCHAALKPQTLYTVQCSYQ